MPNGDILVAETDAPPKSENEGGGGVRGFFMGLYMRQAGSNKPSANRITLLRDADGDGVAETKEVFLENLNSPFGMALVGDQLYVANADSLVRFPYKEGDTRIEAAPEKVVGSAGGTQSSLDEEPCRRSCGFASLRRRRVQLQCRREWHGGRA